MGFSSSWLALREPADLIARNSELLQQAAVLAGPNPVIMDLGSGTGSMVRALAAELSDDAQWRLVDNDAALLKIASELDGVIVHQQDLNDLDQLPFDDVTLVSGSALLDLVSQSWLEKLVAKLRTPGYFSLCYDGHMNFDPEDLSDQAITVAFNLHQERDKGFGPALGPGAINRAVELFEAAGFDVFIAPSPWLLGPDQAQLQLELIGGVAQAAHEAGAELASDWKLRRSELVGVSMCSIGHQDILVIPPKHPRP